MSTGTLSFAVPARRTLSRRNSSQDPCSKGRHRRGTGPVQAAPRNGAFAGGFDGAVSVLLRTVDRLTCEGMGWNGHRFEAGGEMEGAALIGRAFEPDASAQ